MAEYGQKRMSIHGIIGIFRDSLAHNLTKYQYVCMRPINSFSTIKFLLKCGFDGQKWLKTAQNRS